MKPLRILVLLPRVPWPLEKGDKLRAYHQLRMLARTHEVHVWALSDRPPDPQARPVLEPLFASFHISRLSWPGILLNVLRSFLLGQPLQVGYFFHPPIRKAFQRFAHEIKPDHVYFQLPRTVEYARGLEYPKTLDFQDAFSAGMLRQAGRAPWYLKPLLRMEHRRMQRYETSAFGLFDHLTIISATDRELIRHPRRQDIRVVPNGVDTSFFSPMEKERDHDILFTGNMAYSPNVDAAHFLVRTLMPRVWERYPKARVMLAGATPSAEVRALAGPLVTVTGWMEDIRQAYAGARVFIAPMRIGTGMQNKLLEAMAMGLPCITTTLASKPFAVRSGKEVLIGDTPESLADHILHLLSHPPEAAVIGGAGLQYVRTHHSWESMTALLEDILIGAPSAVSPLNEAPDTLQM